MWFTFNQGIGEIIFTIPKNSGQPLLANNHLNIYRFPDELNAELKPTIEQIMFDYTRKLLKNKIGVVFYDMTTLYFEASEEDDYRIPGFNKDGKHQQPQIMIGLLVSNHGYPIGYQIFEGNT